MSVFSKVLSALNKNAAKTTMKEVAELKSVKQVFKEKSRLANSTVNETAVTEVAKIEDQITALKARQTRNNGCE